MGWQYVKGHDPFGGDEQLADRMKDGTEMAEFWPRAEGNLE